MWQPTLVDHRGDLPQVVIGMAVTRDGIPIRCWTWPGNTNDSALIRQVKDDLRAWKLGRVVWVADRGFASAENRRYLQRCGGNYIIGEKLRGDSKEAAAALARAGRYHQVAGNLGVKEVVIDDGVMRDRFVVCHNPEQAERDALVRDQLVAQVQDAIAGSDRLSSAKRATLAGELRAQRGLVKFRAHHQRGPGAQRPGGGARRAAPGRQVLVAHLGPPSAPRTSPWATSSSWRSSEAGGT